MKSILVTGGAGFIGQHLCRRLLEDGHRVVCVDDFSTGSRDAIAGLSREHGGKVIAHDAMFSDLQIAQFMPGQFHVVPADMASVDLRRIGIGEFDEIYNLACPASPVLYQLDPVRTLRTSVNGALAVLEAAMSWGAKVLQASTSEVYGDPLEHPQSETYLGNVNPIGPRACYDEGKRCAETLFFDYRRKFDARIKVARIFNTYGPGMARHDGRVVSTFINQALAGDHITVHGDGSQTRSLCYVDDMVHGLVALMESPGDATGPVNLGNPEEVTILALAEAIKGYTQSLSAIVYAPLPADDPKRRRPDISLARSLLDWAPTTPLHAGLARTIEAFKMGRAA